MNAFRALLVLILVTVVVYTIPVVLEHGLMALMPTYFGDILKMGWPGQFNLDFMGFLTLSALWTAWRNQYSPVGLVLAIVAFLGGVPFLTAYLLFLSFEAKGDIRVIMLGEKMARAEER